MADTKISDMTDLATLADGDELAVADADDLTANKSFTLASLRGFLQGLHTNVGGLPLIKVLTSDATENETATMVEVTGLTYSSQPLGRWLFEYNLIVQSADVANSFKFAVDHSGTTTGAFIYWMLVMGNSATAAVGAWDQEVNATTGFVISSFATRAKNTTLGPGTGVDTANADLLVKILGMYQNTGVGNLKLMHGSELVQANGTTVKAGSSLVLMMNETNF